MTSSTEDGRAPVPASGPSDDALRIVIADDHRSIRHGLRVAFEEAGVVVVGEASDGNELVDLVAQHVPDVVLTDLSMPRCGGIEATRRIREQMPASRVVILTMHDDIESVRSALLAGACAFLSKDCAFSEVLETVQKVAKGETVLSANIASEVLRHLSTNDAPSPEILSARQLEVLQCVANGLNTTQIARRFGLSPKTVNNHLAAIYRRLDAQNLTQAILRAVRLGIIALD